LKAIGINVEAKKASLSGLRSVPVGRPPAP
jgi:hypothetical protein